MSLPSFLGCLMTELDKTSNHPSCGLEVNHGEGACAVVPAAGDASRPDFTTFQHLSGVYEYHLADGRTSHFVLRFDPPGGEKQIRPYSYTVGANGKGEWAFSLPSKPRPLYRLPDLIASPEAKVMVLGGERAACAAARYFPGFVVTTSGGATSLDSVDWRPLAGCCVWILPDNDEPGHRYALHVAEQAHLSGAKEVRCVELPPGLPIGWDVADSFPADFSLAELERLVIKAPWVPKGELEQPSRRSPLVRLNMDRLRDAPSMEREWLWEGLIPLGVPGLVGAVSDHGKTSLMLQLAAGVATARPVLGRATVSTPMGVLMVLLEDDHEDEVKPRVDSVAETFEGWTEEDESNYRKHFWPFVPNWECSLDTSFARIHEELEHQLSMMVSAMIRPALLVIDTFAAVSDGSENEASSSRILWAVARALARKFGVTVIFTHHLRKEGQTGRDKSPIHERLHPSMMRGSSANEGAARFILQLGWVTWEEAEKAGLDPEKAYNLGYAVARVSKVKAAKPEMLFLDRLDPSEPGQGCFRLHPEGERIIAELFKNKGKLKELGLQFMLLVELSNASQPIDRDLMQRAIFGEGAKARKSMENALTRLRKDGHLKPRSVEVTEQGLRFIQEQLSDAPHES